MQRLIPITLAAGSLTACSDFDSPAELPHPQILAVVADPPIIPVGGRAELTVLVAGPDGLMAPRVQWRAPVIVDNDGRAWLEAPLDAEPGFVTVHVAVTLPDGTLRTAEKVIGVATDAAGNPTITAVRIDGYAVDKAATLHRDWLVELSADVSPAPNGDAAFSWYASVGELAFYRRTRAELTTPDEPRSGDLFLVYRDGVGGVAWRHVTVVVE